MNALACHLIDRADRLGRFGRESDAALLYREASALAPDSDTRYAALVGLSRSLLAVGDPNAIAACQEAIRGAPDCAAAYGILALAFEQHDRFDDAATAAAEACKREPTSLHLNCLAASIALRLHKFDRSVALASLALSIDPSCQRARALRWVARVSNGDDPGDLAPEQIVRICSPPPPPGFTTMAAFNSSLSAAITESELLAQNDTRNPLIGGRRLHDLFMLDPQLAEAMRAMLEGHAEIYPTSIAGRSRPRRTAIRAWANVMQSGDYEAAHIHERGWLSAVYYPAIPEAGMTGGEIVFGPHELGDDLPPPPRFVVRPEPGQLILFPSWLYHSTLPFLGAGLRVSIAVDFVPVD